MWKRIGATWVNVVLPIVIYEVLRVEILVCTGLGTDRRVRQSRGLKPALILKAYAALKGPLFHGDARIGAR